MKITVLVDNNTIIDRYFPGEPGVSFFIEDSGKNILFDTGYSDIFIGNAQKLGLSMYDVDYLVISHGHLDHTWGLVPLIKLYTEAQIERLRYEKPVLLAHTQAFQSKYHVCETIGSIVAENTLADHFEMNLGKEPFWLTERLVYLGEIKRTNDYENKRPIGKCMYQGCLEDDYLKDDTALAYKSKDGLVIITGCSHSGICNIVEQAKRICNEERVADIIGGLHLLDPDREQLEMTRNYIRQAKVKELHPCHCTDLHSKIALSEAAPISEVGVGLVLEYE